MDDTIYVEVRFDNRDRAEKTIKDMIEIAETYGHVSKADLYDLMDLETDYTDTKVYWLVPSIEQAKVVRICDGWTILFPSPIDERSTVVYRHFKDGYYRSERYNKPEPKPINITIDTDVREDMEYKLKAAFEQIKTVPDRDVFIYIN